MGMIDELLFIKDFRERKAERELLRTRLDLQQAHGRHSQAQDTLVDFQSQAQQQEQQWFSDLCTRLVKPKEILAVHADVAQLRATEADLAVQLEEAHAAHQMAQEVYALATDQHREATVTKNKFLELAQSMHAAEQRERERRDEMELEEVASQIRKRIHAQEPGDE